MRNNIQCHFTQLLGNFFVATAAFLSAHSVLANPYVGSSPPRITAMLSAQDVTQKREMLQQIQMLLKQSNGNLAPHHMGMLSMVVVMAQQNEATLDSKDKEIIQTLREIIKPRSAGEQKSAINKLSTLIDEQLDVKVTALTPQTNQKPRQQIRENTPPPAPPKASPSSVEDSLARMQAVIQEKARFASEQSSAIFADHKQTTYDAMSVDEKLIHILNEEEEVNIDELNLLVKQGANIEQADPRSGNRPIHIAAQNGKRNAVEALLTLGAKRSTSNTNGMTPTKLANRYGHSGVATLLRKSYADTSNNTDTLNHANTNATIAADQTSIEFIRLNKFFYSRPKLTVFVAQYTQDNLDALAQLKSDRYTLERASREHTADALNHLKTLAAKYTGDDIDQAEFSKNLDIIIKETKPLYAEWYAKNGDVKALSAKELEAFFDYSEHAKAVWPKFENEVDSMQRAFDEVGNKITASDLGTMEQFNARKSNDAAYEVALQKMIDEYKLTGVAMDWWHSWDRNGHIKGNASRLKSMKNKHNRLYGERALNKLRQKHMPDPMELLRTVTNKMWKKMVPEHLLKIGDIQSMSAKEHISVNHDTRGLFFYFINNKKKRYGNSVMMNEFAKADNDHITLSLSNFKPLTDLAIIDTVTSSL